MRPLVGPTFYMVGLDGRLRLPDTQVGVQKVVHMID